MTYAERRTGARTSFGTNATVLICVCLLSAVTPARAQERPGVRADQVRVEYVAPKNPAHQPVYELLKENRVLEKLQELLMPLRLPAHLVLRTDGCDGVSNAWYEDQLVTVCYEYIEDLIRNAPQETTERGISRQDAIIGPMIEVFLHEAGHAVFDILRVPLFGREEDAADQFAAYALLQFGHEETPRIIGGIAYMYAREAGQQNLRPNDFANAHSVPAQRLFNLLCMAYGADPKLFADLVDKGDLPRERAETCGEEYQQIAYAFKKHIVPHMDETLRLIINARFKSQQWLKPEQP